MTADFLAAFLATAGALFLAAGLAAFFLVAIVVDYIELGALVRGVIWGNEIPCPAQGAGGYASGIAVSMNQLSEMQAHNGQIADQQIMPP